MQLTEDEITDLAAFLARRVTPALQRPDPSDAPEPGRTPQRAWAELLATAQSSGSLPRTLRAAAQVVPEDRSLQEASTLVDRPLQAASLAAGGAMFLAAAAAVVVVGLGMSALGIAAAIEAATPDRSSSVSLATSPAVPAAFVAATSAGNESPVARAPVVAPTLPALVLAAPIPRVEDGPPEGSLGRSACGSHADGPVGWFYAGREDPGYVGARFVVPHRTNVREVAPSRANGWDRSAKIRCLLERGDVVAISAPAVELPGGHWWVPLQGGDAMRPIEVASLD